jgi:hypothetical protein
MKKKSNEEEKKKQRKERERMHAYGARSEFEDPP